MSEAKPHSEQAKTRFQLALHATIKTLSGNDEINVQFQNHANADFNINTGNNQASVAYPEQFSRKEQLISLRGHSDLLSYYLKHHSASLHHQLSLEVNSIYQPIFDTAERIRIESIAINELNGVASNIEHNIKTHYDDLVLYGEEAIIQYAVSAVIRHYVSDRNYHETMQKLIKDYGLALTKPSEDSCSQLKEHLYNQNAYGLLIQNIIKELELSSSEAMTQNVQPPAPEPDPQHNEAQDNASVSNGSETVEPSDMGEEQHNETRLGGLSDDRSESNESLNDSDLQLNEYEYPYHHNSNNTADNSNDYNIYTKQYDEIIHAESMCSYEELKQLRTQLDRKLSQVKDVTKRAANKLQMKLMAQQLRSWNFAQEEGVLDNGRLANIIIDPNYPYLYKNEKQIEHIDTVVTLLIDNSGSMRGRPITIAALSADMLARTLEKCGIKVEILGFTSCDWKGGKSRKLWMQQGKPKHPGRLNDLRHIIYKSADTPLRKAQKNLGLMLREGILKENIDGEALLWASERLLTRSEKRKILMVISDGAPVDDSTLSSNSSSYLEQHLVHAIHSIETSPYIELLAIGIGHDVTRYYKRAVTIREAEQLGNTMFRELSELL